MAAHIPGYMLCGLTSLALDARSDVFYRFSRVQACRTDGRTVGGPAEVSSVGLVWH